MVFKMTNAIKKSDFVLTPYTKSNDFRAAYQILNTVLPYVLLWFLAFKAVYVCFWLLPPIMVLMTLFSVRCFSLMHDCGHYSLFNSKGINRLFGFILGVINAIPFYSWVRIHNNHHKTNGNWEKYRGPSGLLSIDEFMKLSAARQRYYELLRHPLMSIPAGFLYIILKPRINFAIGLCGFTGYLITCLKKDFRVNILKVFYSYKSKYWHTRDEFLGLFFNNVCVIVGCIAFSYFLEIKFFLSIYLITLTFSSAISILSFSVQHTFEGSYAHQTEGWNYVMGAIKGSSYLQLPTILKWFSADIGYHNIHHLSEKIPNYHLENCHRRNILLLSDVKILRIRDVPECFKFILWDSKSNNLISIKSYRQHLTLNSRY
jgi:acyl-lipid omega-6 desaturase (Delta-12 desaturase)